MLKLKGELRGTKEMKDEVRLPIPLHTRNWTFATKYFFSSSLIQNSSSKHPKISQTEVGSRA